MDTAEIRRRFLAHFEERGHQAVPSASLLLDDPNLLFVNAGMVPFKPYFLGQETPPSPRAVSIQKCVRTPDIEDVGKTTRHGTFFEMCGNFSFGDYFKEGAIELAWDLATRSVEDGGFGFEESRLHPSILAGDDEALELWMKVTGLPSERIVKLGPKENYWSMGVPGPGGPCSEILYDRGPEYGPDGEFATTSRTAMPPELEDRYLEIWNLVFMQEELSAVRSKEDFDVLGPLPNKNIDTGMGLERVAFLLQDKQNMYEIDAMFPVIERASELSGRRYGADHADDVRFRVVGDHVRSAMMLISDGVTPGNEARGYVLRRLLRRAVRSMRLLGVEDRVLPELLPVSRDRMKLSYPELERDWERVSTIAFAEEEAFRQTLKAGTNIFDMAAGDAKRTGQTQLSGGKAFSLHDTYGFPIDLTLEMAAEQGLTVDEEGFRRLMTEQRERAKADAKAKKGKHADATAYREVADTIGAPVEFTGYNEVVSEATVRGIVTAAGSVASAGQMAEGPGATAAGKRGKVTLLSSRFGPMLFTGRGQALYLFKRDGRNKSNCYGNCAAAWPPFTTRGNPIAGKRVRRRLLGTTRRRGSARQITYRGHPLYTYAPDEEPGDANGQGLNDVWYVVAPDGEAVTAAAAEPAPQDLDLQKMWELLQAQQAEIAALRAELETTRGEVAETREQAYRAAAVPHTERGGLVAAGRVDPRKLQDTALIMLEKKSGETSGLRAQLCAQAAWRLGDLERYGYWCEWLAEVCPREAGNAPAVDWARRQRLHSTGS